MAIDEQGEENKIPENQRDSAPAESNKEADVESEEGQAREEGDGEDKGEKEDEDDKEDEDEQELDREEEKQSVTPNERPTRERKIVNRYFPTSPVRSSATKPLLIPKGSGTLLKDIPNVAYKLSKRKPDDNLQLLHTILYGKKAKVHNLKKDIGLFSGFVWIENEEKQRSKVKEKLDKCVKEKLLDFCDVLNIPVNRAIIKKEDISAKLLEFLQSPHATTDVLLADREQKGKKRKSNATPIRSSSSEERSAEKASKKAKVSEKQKKTSKDEEESEDKDKHESSDVKDESMDEDGDKKAPKEESDEDEINSEEGDESKEQMTTPKSKENSGSKSSKTHKDIKKHCPEKPSPESKKKSRRTAKKSDAAEKDSASASQVKGSRSKKQKPEIETKEAKPADQKDSSGKQSGQSRSKPLIKEEGKDKASKKKNAEPSKEELRDAVDKILKEVDFNTATLSDILRQLGTHFGLNLGHRKAEVKEIITEVISNMSDAEDEDDEEEGDDDDEDGKNGEKDKGDDDNA